MASGARFDMNVSRFLVAPPTMQARPVYDETPGKAPRVQNSGNNHNKLPAGFPTQNQRPICTCERQARATNRTSAFALATLSASRGERRSRPSGYSSERRRSGATTPSLVAALLRRRPLALEKVDYLSSMFVVQS